MTATATPAFAASCTPSFQFSGGFTYNWGEVNTPSGTTNQTLSVGGQTNVSGLPAGVTVTDITYAFWIENRIGQDSPGPGAFWMGNNTSSVQGSCTTAGCTVSFTPTAGSGFAGIVTNTARLRETQFPSGETLRAWDINLTWSSAVSPGTYTDQPSGCRNFTTGPSGRFPVTYSGVVGLTSATPDESKRIRTFVRVTVTLSNGTVLSRDIASTSVGP